MDEDQRSEQTPKTHSGIESTPTNQDSHTQATQNSGSSQTEERKHSRWGLTRYEWISTILQGSIFLSAFIYMIFAGLQWRTMDHTLQLSSENIALTKQTVRAWLAITNIDHRGDLIPNSPVKIDVHFKNTGPSVVLNLSWNMAEWICDGPPSLACAAQCPPQGSRHQMEGNSIVGPQGDEIGEFKMALHPPAVLDAIKNRTKTAYFCGTATYQDIFATPHQVDFRIHYRPENNNFSACPIGNSDR
jgi:hypothetical protein